VKFAGMKSRGDMSQHTKRGQGSSSKRSGPDAPLVIMLAGWASSWHRGGTVDDSNIGNLHKGCARVH
jgi:hypothetical protein